MQAGAAMAFAGAMGSRTAWGLPLGLPLGLQLYSVREMLPKDYEGTLKKVAEIGYREVEAAGFYNKPATEVKSAMKTAGLSCVSAHYPWTLLQPNVEKIIAFHKELGTHNIICSSPTRKDGARGEMAMDDWRWIAGQFNEVGKTIKAAGLQFGYHNHVAEFAKADGTVPYDELLRITDPSLVTFEMDCGWVVVGGGDPVAYLTEHAKRISMLHVKDFKAGSAPGHSHGVVLGTGTVDLRKVLVAAKKGGNIKHMFVEQEEFDMEPFAELKADADFMKSVKV